MVKLDVSLIRFLEDEDFRVLTALEMTMRNHEVAPTALVERIAQLPHGGCKKRLSTLLRHKIIHHENTMYDGYSMTYAAYDFLALRTLSKRGSVVGVGSRIGCGKESDIIHVQDEQGNECAMKLQRLGRCSFRTVSRNRDYKGGGRTRRGESWFYLSRLAAQKEYAFMQILYDEGFPVPKPIDQNRHAVVMEYLNATLLNNITKMDQAQLVYERCMALIIRLAEHGLIHGDFNEFNLLVTDDYQVLMIDFPQMVSTDHKNAAELFDRDVTNLSNFFQRRFRIERILHPTLSTDVERKGELDRVAFASGCFSRKQQQELESMLLMMNTQSGDEEDEDSTDGGNDSAGERRDGTSKDGQIAQHTKTTVEFHSIRETTVESPLEEVGNANASHAEEEEGVDSVDDNETGVEGRPPRRVDRAKESNPNITPTGDVNEDYIKTRVKRDLKHKDNRDFNRTLHRNTQKGRQKQKIQRQLKSANGAGFFD